MVATFPLKLTGQRRLDTRVEIAGWLPLLTIPFVFGAVVKVFPIETSLALATLGLFTLALVAFDALVGMPRLARVVSTAVLLLVVLSLPFWCMQSEKITPPPRPIYSFREAKADPHSFYRWWAFFVEEVFKANAIVLGPDPGILPHRPVPGARTTFYKGEIVINNRGYRGDDIPDSKGETFRIVTIGDSTTFGQTLFLESRPWSAVLQDLIRQRLRCDRLIQVINGGVNAWELKNGIDRIEADMRWLAPDMVVPYIAFNGLPALDRDRHWIPGPKEGELDLLPPGSSQSAVIAWFIKKAALDFRSSLEAKLAEMMPVRPRNRDESLTQVRASSLYRDYERLIELGQRHGFRVILLSANTAIGPNSPQDAIAFYEGGFRDARARVALVQILNRALEDLAQNHSGVVLLDTSEGLYGRYDEDLFLDLVHFTPAGDTRMAENVFQGLKLILAADQRLNCIRR